MAEHGRNGYYFVANGDVEFEKVTEVVETRAGTCRIFTDNELKVYFASVRTLSTLGFLTEYESRFLFFLFSPLCKDSSATMGGGGQFPERSITSHALVTGTPATLTDPTAATHFLACTDTMGIYAKEKKCSWGHYLCYVRGNCFNL